MIATNSHSRFDLLGTPVDALRMEDALALATQAVERRERLLFGVINAAKVVKMRQDPELRDAVHSADLILADGMSIVWAGRLLGFHVPERVTGIDLMSRLLALSEEHGFRVYLLGATQEVLEQAVAKIRAAHPKITLAGWHHGYFNDAEEADVAAEVAAARPDLLFVAMTSPKKERFLVRWAEQLQVSVCHGVGGAFDVVAGKVRRAPALWQRLGLEWLYRVVQEPRRMWRRYLVTNTLFALLVLREMALRWLWRRQPRGSDANQRRSPA